MPDQPKPDFSSDISAVGAQYPALAPYLKNTRVQWGASSPGDDRQLEFYPPWEEENPNKGAITLELYNRGLTGAALQSAIAGDMFHMLGSVDPRTNQPIDPKWLALRNQLMAARSPHNEAIDQQAYAEDKANGETGSYEDWLARNRSDAYIRGYLTPDHTDEWRKQGVYGPQMVKVLDQMHQYLMTPPVAQMLASPPPQANVLQYLQQLYGGEAAR